MQKKADACVTKLCRACERGEPLLTLMTVWIEHAGRGPVLGSDPKSGLTRPGLDAEKHGRLGGETVPEVRAQPKAVPGPLDVHSASSYQCVARRAWATSGSVCSA